MSVNISKTYLANSLKENCLVYFFQKYYLNIFGRTHYIVHHAHVNVNYVLELEKEIDVVF